MQRTFVDAQLEPAIFYSNFWLSLAIILIICVAFSIFLVYYLTRKCEIKTLSNLNKLEAHPVNLAKLRAKYSKMIDELSTKLTKGEVSNSVAHQQLSLIVRLFFCEAIGFHAEVMSLADIRATKHQSLSKLIEQYYPAEFSTLEQGDFKLACERAHEIIEELN